MNRETLDETIDRVAGEMSAVTANPTLTAQVCARMDARRRPWLMPSLAAASVAAVVVSATVLWPRSDRSVPPAPPGRELAADAVAPNAPLAEGGPSARVDAMVDAESEPGMPPHPAPDDAAGGAAVRLNTSFVLELANAGAPTAPAPLAIPELTIRPLAVPDDPEIAPLQIESLRVAEIDFEASKEQR